MSMNTDQKIATNKFKCLTAVLRKRTWSQHVCVFLVIFSMFSIVPPSCK